MIFSYGSSFPASLFEKRSLIKIDQIIGKSIRQQTKAFFFLVKISINFWPDVAEFMARLAVM